MYYKLILIPEYIIVMNLRWKYFVHSFLILNSTQILNVLLIINTLKIVNVFLIHYKPKFIFIPKCILNAKCFTHINSIFKCIHQYKS